MEAWLGSQVPSTNIHGLISITKLQDVRAGSLWSNPSLLMKTLSSQRDLHETEAELSQDSCGLPPGLCAGADLTFLSPFVSPGGAGGYFPSHGMLQPLSHDSHEGRSDCTGLRNYSLCSLLLAFHIHSHKIACCPAWSDRLFLQRSPEVSGQEFPITNQATDPSAPHLIYTPCKAKGDLSCCGAGWIISWKGVI